MRSSTSTYASVLLGMLLTSLAGSASATLRIFACEPEWQALAEAIGGDRVEAWSATQPFQDPHRLEARPSLLARVRSADLVICTGAELEIGWLPLLLRRAGNPRVLAGKPGLFYAADQVRRLEVPDRLDRAQGDIHPAGNPHVHLDPGNIETIARALSERLGELDPDNRGAYESGLDGFLVSWQTNLARWEPSREQLRGTTLITHHRSYSYLAAWLGLEVVNTIEPRPGIPPSSAHLSTLLEDAREHDVRAILLTPYTDSRPAEWLSERTGIPVLTLPYTVGENHTARDLTELFDATLAMLTEAIAAGGGQP